MKVERDIWSEALESTKGELEARREQWRRALEISITRLESHTPQSLKEFYKIVAEMPSVIGEILDEYGESVPETPGFREKGDQGLTGEKAPYLLIAENAVEYRFRLQTETAGDRAKTDGGTLVEGYTFYRAKNTQTPQEKSSFTLVIPLRFISKQQAPARWRDTNKNMVNAMVWKQSGQKGGAADVMRVYVQDQSPEQEFLQQYSESFLDMLRTLHEYLGGLISDNEPEQTDR